MSDIKHKFAEALVTAFSDEKKSQKVIKSIPMRPTWQKLHKAFCDSVDEAQLAHHRMDSLRKKFWSTVEGDLSIFDKSLRVNTEKNELEVLEDEK